MQIIFTLISFIAIVKCTDIYKEVYVGNDVRFKFIGNQYDFLDVKRTNLLIESRFEIEKYQKYFYVKLTNIIPSDDGVYEIYINYVKIHNITLIVSNGTCNDELHFNISSGMYRLICFMSPNMNNLVWTLNGDRYIDSNGSSVKINSMSDRYNNKNNKYHITIISFNIFNNTNYVFKLIGHIGNQSYAMNPVIVRTTTKIITAMVNDNITLYCLSNNDYWMKLLPTFNWCNASKFVDGKLTMTNLTKYDSGNYLCRNELLINILSLVILDNGNRNSIQLIDGVDEFTMNVRNDVKFMQTNLMRLKRISYLEYDIHNNSMKYTLSKYNLLLIIILILFVI